MMKTTVTIPNPIHEAAVKLADQMDLSLSDLYTVALTAYVTAHQTDEAHQTEDITAALNRVYETEPSTVDSSIVKLQLKTIGGERW
jgi:hypothetical protein